LNVSTIEEPLYIKDMDDSEILGKSDSSWMAEIWVYRYIEAV